MRSSTETVSDPTAEAALRALEIAAAQVSTMPTHAMTNRDRLTLLRRVETVTRMLPAAALEWTAQMAEQWSNTEFAANNLVDTLADTLRITPAEARARWRAADDLAHHTGITGETIAPPLPATATAHAEGALAPAHVKIIRDVIAHLPAAVDPDTRSDTETMLADQARELRPDQLRKVADKLEALINPDGTFTDTDRARRRAFTMSRQGPDLMTKCTVTADPELRAYLEAVFAKYAKPGTLNPEDSTPIVEDPNEEVAQRDTRTAPQRQHDAVKALLRDSIASGRLGQHRGLPVTVVVSMTLDELEDATSQAVFTDPTVPLSGPPVATGGGAMISIGDALRLASHAHHYLALFDHTTGRPLYLGRTKRIATPDQRIVLHSRDIGCTFPGCTKPGYLCQVHHRTEWANGGTTDADQLTFVCEPHHRQAGAGDAEWETTTAAAGHPDAGRTQWIPPVHLDPSRRPRVNRYHHPGEYLTCTRDSVSSRPG
ncbi:HNH endonuclease signature motif containing protein [Nocardia sp. alder85J]|uniref:HNH endonuclease signature motif containing protein n=1 Tax=Nocardia sp. alder85J TaxID=2862949 RepID=UPI001CD2C3FB|nr:HNH endonuclease signature motif containing protein [Nocardia sp. alder85J]MCX4093962.1 HNH endonuclease signature motif containing protein [Nocardia sp. alder85J]